MDSQYAFSPDDTMNPVFCLQCRKQIPRSESEKQGGFCPECTEAWKPKAKPEPSASPNLYCSKCGIGLTPNAQFCAQCGQATATPSYSAPSIHTPNYTPPERTNTSAIAGGVFSGVLAVFGLLVIMGSIVGCNNAHAGADAWLSSQGAMGAAGLQIPGTIKDGANKNAIFGVVIGCCMMIPYALARNSGNRH